MTDTLTAGPNKMGDLRTRAIVGAGLIVAAIVALVAGGVLWWLLAAAAAIGMLIEWSDLVHASPIKKGIALVGLGFGLLLAGIHVALGLLWFAALIAATVPIAGLLRVPVVVQWLDRVTGCVFVAFGLRLALERR